MTILNITDNRIIPHLQHTLNIRTLAGQSLIINNEIHTLALCGALWRTAQSKHLKYNINTHKFEVLFEFDNHKAFNFGCIGAYQLVNIRNKKILAFSGDSCKIHQYCLRTNKWWRLSVKMPSSLSGFSCVAVLNDEYVGGDTNFETDISSIMHVLNYESFEAMIWGGQKKKYSITVKKKCTQK